MDIVAIRMNGSLYTVSTIDILQFDCLFFFLIFMYLSGFEGLELV